MATLRERGAELEAVLSEVDAKAAEASQAKEQVAAASTIGPWVDAGEMRILFMAAKQGPNVLSCMPSRTKCMLSGAPASSVHRRGMLAAPFACVGTP
jgi:hypothetical protein